MKKRLLTYISLLILCLLGKSCIKDGDFDFRNTKFTENFIYDLPIPLADARLTMSDLLKNIPGQYIVADSTGLLKIVYKQEFSYDFSNLEISVPNQSLELSSDDPITVLPGNLFPADSIIVPSVFWLPLENDPTNPSVRIDSLIAKTVDFRLQVYTAIRNKVRIEFKCPYILDSMGQPFSTSVTLPGVRFGSQQTTLSLNLTNHHFIPNNSFPGNPQLLKFESNTVVFKDAAVTASYKAETNMFAFFENFDVDAVYGYLGREILGPMENTIDLPIMDKFTMDLLEVEKANMQLTVTNALGLPVLLSAEISTLTNNLANPVKTLIISERLNYPNSLLAPPSVTTFQEEIQSLINDNAGKLPYQMQYSVKVETNPDSNPFLLNFLSKNSFIKMDVSAEIPMKLKIAGLTISDTMSFAGLPYSDGIEFFTIKANLHNAFPLAATVFLHFLNEQQEVVDSLKIADIKGAPVDQMTMHVIQPEITQVDINLSETQIRHLVDTRYFKIKGVLNTTDPQNGLVGIYEDSENEGFLKVMLGCRLKASGKLISSFSDLVDENK